MAAPIIAPTCCPTDCSETPQTMIPGPAGAAGAAGAAGTNGANSFATVVANYIQPAIGADVTVEVTSASTATPSEWAVVGQAVYVTTGGYYTVQAQVDGTHISIRNLGYTGNAAPAAGITQPQQIGPAGIKGTDGSAGSTDLDIIIDATFGATSARGQLLVDNGAATPNSNAVKLSPGTDGQILVSLSTDPTGLDYRTVIPIAATDNGIPRFDGATGTPIPLQTSFVVITDTGAVQASGSGGNARGTSATDLQVVRSVATQVASAARSGLVAGQNNTASAVDSSVVAGNGNTSSAANAHVGGGNDNVASNTSSVVVGGDTNMASGLVSFIGGGANNVASNSGTVIGGGEDNVASGGLSFIGGGQDNTASASYSSVGGGLEAVASHYGERAQSAGAFASNGDAQVSDFVLRRSTANATPAEMFLDGTALRLTIPDDTTWTFDILIVARRTDANDESAAYRLVGCIDRNVGVATTALVGSVTKTVIAEDTAAWDCAFTADAANGAGVITVTGEAAKNIQWTAVARIVQTTG